MDRCHAAGKGPPRVALFLLMLGLGSISSAQQQASQEEPTFHSTTRLVVLDVVVTDQAGKPVTNLSQADFTLLEDGAPQSVASFESPKSRPDTPVYITSKSSKAEAKSAPNDSAPSPSALTILVLDELNSEVLDQAYARSAIQKFLRTHGPRLGQPTSLVLLGEKRLELLHDYSQNANALLEALHQRHAELPFGLMTAELSGAGERMSKTLWALQQIAAANNHFAGRKNVIWVGPGFTKSFPPSGRSLRATSCLSQRQSIASKESSSKGLGNVSSCRETSSATTSIA